jgi:ABC-2 type transport system permease protein
VLLYVPLTGVIGLSCYALGTFLGGLVLRAMSTRNVVANVTHTTMMAICGVNVPLAFWPDGVQWIAHGLPLTHGLRAIRGVLGEASTSSVLVDIAYEAAVGGAWLVLALLTFNHLAESGRRDGSIEFGA